MTPRTFVNSGRHCGSAAFILRPALKELSFPSTGRTQQCKDILQAVEFFSRCNTSCIEAVKEHLCFFYLVFIMVTTPAPPGAARCRSEIWCIVSCSGVWTYSSNLLVGAECENKYLRQLLWTFSGTFPASLYVKDKLGNTSRPVSGLVWSSCLKTQLRSSNNLI